MVNEHTLKSLSVSLRVSAFGGGEYIVYDAMENRALRRYADGAEIPLTLEPYNSLVLIFGEIQEDVSLGEPMQPAASRVLEAPCEVELSPAGDFVEFRSWRRLNSLINVTGSEGEHRR